MSATTIDSSRRSWVILANYVRFAATIWPELNWVKVTTLDSIGVSIPANCQVFPGEDSFPLEVN
jgi:hypothetical protein